MSCCNNKRNNCGPIPGCIRHTKPVCPPIAVIPAITVDNPDSVQTLKDCFVHVSSNNTTYYVDDLHRIIEFWAGPVEVDNYDFINNPLHLRSQMVYDFANNRGIYYDAKGEYRIILLTGESE